MKRRTLGLLAAALFATPVLAQAQSVPVGAIEILSGPNAAYGIAIKAGLELALDEVNAKGVLGGRKIELTVEDSAGSPDQAVNAAAAHPDIAHAKNMVNALLRRFLRERDSLLETALKIPAAQWNYPQWWIDSCQTAYPKQWQSILEAGNRQPPLTLRINQRRTTMQSYLSLLQENGMMARPPNWIIVPRQM